MESSTPITIKELIEALLDLDKPLNPRYLYRFSDLEGAELKELAQFWPQVPVWRRQAIMEDIESLGEADSLLSFEAFCRYSIGDTDATVRELAIRSLGDFDSPDMIPVFLDLMVNDVAVNVRAAAATALGKYVYMGEVDELQAATLHRIEEQLLEVAQGNDQIAVRRRALESLGYSSRAEVPGLIQNAYASGNQDWLVSALFAMGRSANPKWAPLLTRMLDNSSAEVRAEAVRAIGELELKKARPRLLRLLEDEDADVRMASVWSLSQIGGEGVQDALEALYEMTEDDEEAEFIASALENLAFTEEMDLMPLLDIYEEDEADLLDFGVDDEDETD